MGEGPGEPADRDPLQPPADQRHAVAGGVDTVVALREDAGNVVEPAGRTVQPGKSQWHAHPDQRSGIEHIVEQIATESNRPRASVAFGPGDACLECPPNSGSSALVA